MGCDIHSYVEINRNGKWEYIPKALGTDEYGDSGIFPGRSYALFGFLADVRNYSESPVIAEPRGLPEDVSPELRVEYDPAWDIHTPSWLTVEELLAYDYEQVFWDRRGAGFDIGTARAGVGEGDHLSLRDFLSEEYFDRLVELEALGDPASVRVVFWFDN